MRVVVHISGRNRYFLWTNAGTTRYREFWHADANYRVFIDFGFFGSFYGLCIFLLAGKTSF